MAVSFHEVDVAAVVTPSGDRYCQSTENARRDPLPHCKASERMREPRGSATRYINSVPMHTPRPLTARRDVTTSDVACTVVSRTTTILCLRVCVSDETRERRKFTVHPVLPRNAPQLLPSVQVVNPKLRELFGMDCKTIALNLSRS